MAAKNPIRADYDGSDLVGFAEFQASDFIAIADGGTGAITAAGARTALGLAIGTDIQSWDQQLDDIAGLTPSDGAFIIGDGSNFVVESGNTARASLGLSTSDSPQFNGLTLTTLSLDSVTLSGIITEAEGMSGSDNDTSIPTTAAIIDYIANTVDTTEEVQDIVGGMVTSNTETLITVTYDDTDGTLDFVVDNDLANYSNTNSAFITLTDLSVTDSGGDGSLSYDNTTGVITYTGPSASEVRAHFSAGTGVALSSGQISIGQAVGTTDDVTFNTVSADLTGDVTGNVSGNVTGTVSSIANHDTDDLSEGLTNLYFTNARVDTEIDSYLSGGTGVSISSGTISIGQAVATTSDVTFNDLTVSGNLTVSGTTTTVNTETIELADNIIIFNSNATGTATENAGIEIERGDDTNVTLLWDESNDRWTVGAYDFVASTFIGNLTGNVTGTVSDVSNHDTDDIAEGSTNLYYTDTRVNSAFDTRLATKSTSDLSEGTNLYFTEERVDDRVSSLLVAGSNVTLTYDDAANTLTIAATEDNLSNNTTDDLAEGSTNLYFTDARVAAAITGGTGITNTSGTLSIDFTEFDTDNVVEGSSNFYFTNARSRSAISVAASSGLTYNSTTGEIGTSAIPNSQLANSSITINSYATSLGGSVSLDTDDITEGISNLYYTASRFNTAFSGKTTDDLTEGSTNLYLTDERVDDRVANLIQAGTDISVTYDDTAGTLTIANTASLSTEEVQDIVGGQIVTNGTHTGISFAYDDAGDGAIDATVSLASFDTDNLSEGSTNLYYTDARVESYITGGTGIDFSSGTISIDGTVVTESSTDTLTNKTINFEDNTAIVEFAVTVANVSGNKYHLDGETAASIQLIPGITYRFDQSDSTNSGHPLVLSTTQDGTHGGGSSYTTGVTTNGTPGSAGAYTQIVVDAATADTLYYYCSVHSGMGGDSVVSVQGTSLSASDTDDLAEGSSNLYYTDARARGAISVTDSGGDGSLSYNSSTGVITYTGPSASEVQAHFSAGTGVTLSSGEISIGQAVGTSSNVTFNDLTVSGNLTVSGTTTTVNTETIELADNIIVFNSNATGSASENAGIEIERGDDANKTLIWNETDDKWTIGSETFVAGTFEGNLTGNVTGTVSSISNHDTDDLSEGATNLYYTTARFDTAFSGKTTDNLTEGSTNLYYTTTRHNTDFDTRLATKSTTNLSEGTNLYFTDERVDDRVANLLTAGSNITLTYDDASGTLTIAATEDDLSNNTTTDLAEGTNLYHTTERVQDVVGGQFVTNGTHTGISFTYDDANDGAIDATVSLSGFSTSDLSEGTNLYYTDARFDTRLATKDTDNLTEGSTNLYFTNARADARISAADLQDLNNVGFSTPGAADDDKVVFWDNAAGAFGLSTVSGLAGEGEVNTASNIGTAGVGLFDGKVGEDLQFKNINAGSSKITITDDTVNDEVDIDLGTVSIDDLSDVDTTTTAPTNGQALKWNSSGSKWEPGDASSAISQLSDVTLTSLTTSQFLQYNGSAWVNVTVDTDDIAEGLTNLYYTDARAQAAITGGTGISNTSGTLAIDFTEFDTDSLTEGSSNLFYTTTRFNTDLATKTTDNLTEGSTNLYFTNARVDTEIDSYLSGGTGVTYSGGTISIGQAVATTSDVTFNDLTVSGNLTVSGTTTTVNTETINLADNTITLNSNATGSATEDGGIEIERGDDANKTLIWDETNDKWTVGSETFVAGTFEGTATGLATSFVTGLTADSSPADDDLIIVYDTSASGFKKVTKSNIGGGSGGLTGALDFTLADTTEDDIDFLNLGATGTDIDVTLTDGTVDPIQITSTSASATSFTDGDNDTKIQVEPTTDADEIRMFTAGTEAVRINSTGVVDLKTAKLNINGSAGTNGQVLSTDGSGNISWADAGGSLAANDLTDVDTTGLASGDSLVYNGSNFVPQRPTNIEDADGDTRVHVEESADEDKVRIDTGGTERMIIDNNATMSANGGFFIHRTTLASGETFTISANTGTVAAGPLDIEGTVDVAGTLVVV